MIYVGCDAHVRNSYLCVTDAAGQVLRRGRVGNTLGEVAEFLGPVLAPRKGEPVRAVLEATTNSRAVRGLLARYGSQEGVDLTAQVLDARKLRVIAESVGKCDELDAAVLNELARSNLRLPACYVPDDEVFALREHLRARADLVKVRTMLKNRVHALLHRRGLLRPEAGLFTAAGRAWLGEQRASLDGAGRQTLDHYLQALDAVEATVASSTASLRGLADSPRWKPQADLLRTMPGVGLVTSLVILAELGDLSRFASRASVSNYAGLVPVRRSSNDRGYSGHITRRGPAMLRGTLVEAAWVASARVPRYRRKFDAVAARGGKAVAAVAVARTMLEDAYTMLRKNEAFRYAPAARAAGERTAGGVDPDVDPDVDLTAGDPGDAG